MTKLLDLAAQYRADGKARVFVCAVWGNKPYDNPVVESFFSDWLPEQESEYKECADYTLARIEEIRQVQEEIKWLREYEISIEVYAVELKEGQFSDCLSIAEDVRWYCAHLRSLAARRAHLDSLTKGIRPEALR